MEKVKKHSPLRTVHLILLLFASCTLEEPEPEPEPVLVPIVNPSIDIELPENIDVEGSFKFSYTVDPGVFSTFALPEGYFWYEYKIYGRGDCKVEYDLIYHATGSGAEGMYNKVILTYSWQEDYHIYHIDPALVATVDLYWRNSAGDKIHIGQAHRIDDLLLYQSSSSSSSS